jgi:hypothetical protein
MSSSEIKKMYESLLDSGDLFIFFPSLAGEWVKDQKEFKRHYNKNIEDIRDLDFDFDDMQDFIDDF